LSHKSIFSIWWFNFFLFLSAMNDFWNVIINENLFRKFKFLFGFINAYTAIVGICDSWAVICCETRRTSRSTIAPLTLKEIQLEGEGVGWVCGCNFRSSIDKNRRYILTADVWSNSNDKSVVKVCAPLGLRIPFSPYISSSNLIFSYQYNHL
jgi:hypothetical protein